MRILFLTQVLPFPLDAGPKVRAYYTLRYLVEAGHKVTLLSFVRESDSAEALAHLGALCEDVITVRMARARWRDGLAVAGSLFTGEPLLMARDRVPDMYMRLREVATARQFDAIHADQLWMAPYALAASAAAQKKGGKPHLVLDQHNAVYLIPMRLASVATNPLVRLAYRRESARLRHHERRLCLAFDQVVTVSEQDRAHLLALSGKERRPNFTKVIPICVEPKVMPKQQQSAEQGFLLFVGGMHWPPNADAVEWFAEQILPRIRMRLPQVRLLAVGKNPPAKVAAMADRGIDLPGFAEELGPLWERCSAFVVPLRAGGGIRVKILDAWSHGVPVISTHIGAEGLAYVPGENILIADAAEQFSDRVIEVLTDPALAAKLSQVGRSTIAKHYDWRQAYRAWDTIYPAEARVVAPLGTQRWSA